VLDEHWWMNLGVMISEGWMIVPPVKPPEPPQAEFPDGYRAELTGEHDGTGGEYVALYAPDGEEIGRVSGGGWDGEPFRRLAARARIHAEARKAEVRG
jgi:hypothetical protein